MLSQAQVLADTLSQMTRIFNVLSSDPSKLDSQMFNSFGRNSSVPRVATGPVPNTANTSVPNTTNTSAPTHRNGIIPPSLLSIVLIPSLSKCRCGGMMSVRTSATPSQRGRHRNRSAQQQEAPKYLLCNNQSGCPILPLPRRGQFQPHLFNCPVCRYQVIL